MAGHSTLLLQQHHFGMEESAGNAQSDGDEVGLTREDFDPTRARHFRKVYRLAVSNLADAFLGCSDAGKAGEKATRMNHARLELAAVGSRLQQLQSACVRDVELTHNNAAQRSQMGAAAERLAHVMRC